jgi:hypothetical protein
MNLVNPRQRVIDHGEVFTPAWMVDAMLDLVKGESERINSRFLEPACGSGNFLAPVLQRKLATVQTKFGRNEFDKRHNALMSVMCTYGIELLEDNVLECRNRLLVIFRDYLRLPEEDPHAIAAKKVLDLNIIHGDALSMMTQGKTPRPITFAEWAYLGKGRFQRRDFRFDALAQMSSFGKDTLFGDLGKHEIFVPVREYPPTSIAEIAHA